MTSKEKSFQIRLVVRIRFRNVFRLLGPNEIKDFMGQLEAEKSPSIWKEAIPYALKRGGFHRDLINPDGIKIESRKRIPVQSLNEAVEFAINDLKENLESHR